MALGPWPGLLPGAESFCSYLMVYTAWHSLFLGPQATMLLLHDSAHVACLSMFRQLLRHMEFDHVRFRALLSGRHVARGG